jgi:hypothetical protein
MKKTLKDVKSGCVKNGSSSDNETQVKNLLGVGQRGDTITKIGYKNSDTLLICFSQNPGHHKINSQPQGKQIIHF